MKRYTFELTIEEGNDEFWEELLENGKTGCDDLLEHIKQVLDEHVFGSNVKLISYEDT